MEQHPHTYPSYMRPHHHHHQQQQHPPPPPTQGVRGPSSYYHRWHPRNNTSHLVTQNFNGEAPRYQRPSRANGDPRIYQPRQSGVHHTETAMENRNCPRLRILPQDEVAILEFSNFHEVRNFSDPRIYQPHQSGIRQTAMENINCPRLRILPQDEVAILEFSGFHEVRNFNDQNRDMQLDMDAGSYEEVTIPDTRGFHGVRNFNYQNRDMQLDIDAMSYEELLTLEDRVGKVIIGLSKETILSHLKMRIHDSSASYLNFDESANMDQETETCIICLDGFKNQEKIGTLDCGHEYHVDCIKQWLLVNNVCPICKRPALSV